MACFLDPLEAAPRPAAAADPQAGAGPVKELGGSVHRVRPFGWAVPRFPKLPMIIMMYSRSGGKPRRNGGDSKRRGEL